jgi:hypothetical protein
MAAKPGYWQRYTALPRSVRLWIGLTTLGIAAYGNYRMNQVWERERLRKEAEKQLEMEDQSGKNA